MDELTPEKQHPPQIWRAWALLVLGRQLAEFEEVGGLRSKSGGREFDGLTWDEMPFADRRTLAAALRPR